jgi:hypothetical protein
MMPLTISEFAFSYPEYPSARKLPGRGDEGWKMVLPASALLRNHQSATKGWSQKAES